MAKQRRRGPHSFTLIIVPHTIRPPVSLTIPYWTIFALVLLLIVSSVRLAWYVADTQAEAATTARLLRIQQTQIEQAKQMQSTIASQEGQVQSLTDTLVDQADSLATRLQALEQINGQILRAVGLDKSEPAAAPLPAPSPAASPATPAASPQPNANIGPLEPLLPNDRSTIGEATSRGGDRVSSAVDLLAQIDAMLPAKLEEETNLSKEVNDRLAKLSSKPSVPEQIRRQLEIYDAAPKGWPVWGPVTDPFGLDVNRLALGAQPYHKGMDIGAGYGSAIKIMADGVVTFVGWDGSLGLEVEVSHSLGWGTLYGHLSRTVVNNGDKVTKMQIIAYVGNTGLSTGPHLHYEIHYNGVPIDPARYVGQ